MGPNDNELHRVIWVGYPTGYRIGSLRDCVLRLTARDINLVLEAHYLYEIVNYRRLEVDEEKGPQCSSKPRVGQARGQAAPRRFGYPKLRPRTKSPGSSQRQFAMSDTARYD